MTRRAAEVFSPGEILRDELEERGWTQTDLADILGRSVGLVNEVIAGKRGITPETARGLAAALGTSPQFWMNLDAAYQLSRVDSDPSQEISRRAKIYGKGPIKEMVRRGWIEHSENVDVLESQVLRFFELKSIEDEPEAFLHAARKSTNYSAPPSASQIAWLMRVKQLSYAVHAEQYSDAKFDELLPRLAALREEPLEIRNVPKLLSEAGIKLIVCEPLPGTKIDGACFWSKRTPVVAISLRFDRIDNFWFVLAHELRHVRDGESALDIDLDAHRQNEARSKSEKDADWFSADFLVPRVQMDGFIARVKPLYSTRRVEAFAKVIGVHPGIVVGQLQFRGEVPYSSFRKMLVPVRDIVTSSVLTDGWGSALPSNL